MDQLIRVLEILKVCIRFYFKSFVKLKGENEQIQNKRARYLRESIEQLGSVFVKFGQFLAVHPIFLPESYRTELFALLENVPPFPYEQVVEVFKKDLKASPEDTFASFCTVPFAAASFGQVHEAQLKTGEKVAVKVQRPHIEMLTKKDLKIMKFIGKVYDFVFFKSNKLTPAILEFEQWIDNELDYKLEAKANQEYFQYTRNKEDKIYAPKVYRKYSTKHIIVTEYIEGVSLSKIILAIRNKDISLMEKVQEWGYDRKKIGELLTQDFLRQIYLKGFFHADPHPANILYTKDNRLAFIDFGIFGRLSERDRLICLRYSRSFFCQDTENALEALVEMCEMEDMKNMSAFKKDFAKLMKEAYERVERRSINGVYEAGYNIQEVLQLLQKYKAVLPYKTMIYFRTLILLKNLSFYLYPEMKVEEVAHYMELLSLANLAIELPQLMKRTNLSTLLNNFINMHEKNLLKSLAYT